MAEQHESRRGKHEEEPAPPVVTPTDFPPPPGPQPAPTTGAPVTIAPSGVMESMYGEEGEQKGEHIVSAWNPDGSPMDRTRIVRSTVKDADGKEREVTAAATDPKAAHMGAAGQAMSTREMGAAGVTETLSPQTERTIVTLPNLIDRWLDSAVNKKFGSAIGRAPQDLGLVGRGHVVVGHMILMDADTGELHRVLQGTRIDEDKVYVNTRNLPEWLVENPEMATKA